MNILIICTGNLCRSQLAAAYLSQLVEHHNLEDVNIETAGIKAVGNVKIPAGIKEVARESQLKLGSEFGKQINLAMLQRADVILVMEYAQASHLLEMYPKVLSRVHIIGKYDPQKKLSKEIQDPVSFDYKHCLVIYEELKRCLDGFFYTEVLTQNMVEGGKSSQAEEEKDENEDPLHFDFSFN
ncbi:hypothetical protein ACFL27_02815 [candidate division CSSED10-310 bacterium]|uniref:Phosphotyrosine protein phosphatase I domain-containing protein n=1 Tax=candidate division CSSED10-310 bacterium TaxID=2855610 RepID=A0ABV6YSP9_UNCC1